MSTKVDIAPEDYKEKYGFSDSTESYVVRGIRGLNEEVIKEISRLHDEPIWMEQLRLRALKHFLGMKVAKWVPELGDIDYQSLYYFAKTTAKTSDSCVLVPDEMKVEMPLQSYFRMNERNMGQFERTLIIAEPYSEVNYIGGCTAPVYSSQSLHSAIVEMIAKKGSLIKYTTLQNWSKDVF